MRLAAGPIRGACSRRLPTGAWSGWRTVGEVLANFASDPARVESGINDARAEAEPERQLALFRPSERDGVEHIGRSERANRACGRDAAGAEGSDGLLPLAGAD